MNHRHVVLRVVNEIYSLITPKLPPAIIRYRLHFPQEVMPQYRFYMSDINPYLPAAAISMPPLTQIKFTGILLHTKYVGEYTEVEEGDIMGQKITYFREHNGAAALTKVEPGLRLA